METSFIYSTILTSYGAKQAVTHSEQMWRFPSSCKGTGRIAMWANAIQACYWQGAAAKPIKWYEPNNKWFLLHDLKKPTASKFNHVTMQWKLHAFLKITIPMTSFNSQFQKDLLYGLRCRNYLSKFQKPSQLLVGLKLWESTFKKCEKPINVISLIFHFW